MESRKITQVKLFAKQKYTDIENRIMDRVVGEEGEGGTDGESKIETYTFSSVQFSGSVVSNSL